jgi:hypothetical protein
VESSAPPRRWKQNATVFRATLGDDGPGKFLVHETRCVKFSAPLNHGEFIIRELISPLMNASWFGLARRGKARSWGPP